MYTPGPTNIQLLKVQFQIDMRQTALRIILSISLMDQPLIVLACYDIFQAAQSRAIHQREKKFNSVRLFLYVAVVWGVLAVKTKEFSTICTLTGDIGVKQHLNLIMALLHDIHSVFKWEKADASNCTGTIISKLPFNVIQNKSIYLGIVHTCIKL